MRHCCKIKLLFRRVIIGGKTSTENIKNEKNIGGVRVGEFGVKMAVVAVKTNTKTTSIKTKRC